MDSNKTLCEGQPTNSTHLLDNAAREARGRFDARTRGAPSFAGTGASIDAACGSALQVSRAVCEYLLGAGLGAAKRVRMAPDFM